MKIIKAVGCVILAELIGGLGALFTYTAIPTWYATLNKPSFSPPNYLFAPVWTLLYALMGLALYLVWESKAKNKMWAYIVFYTQLVLNFLWSFIFFGQKIPGLAFVEIIILWILILVNIVSFWRINKWAGIMLLPYIVWVSFASILNFALFKLN
jgi:tryptophan-rich sensory protein